MEENLKNNTNLTLVGEYKRPPVDLLGDYASARSDPDPDTYSQLTDIFENKLRDRNVKAHFVKAIKGPTVTLCMIKLEEKCPFSRLASARTDLQRWLRSPRPIAIIPQVDNTDLCGVEIPNAVKEVVGLKEILSGKEYLEAKGDLIVPLGKTARGEILVDDLAAMPHALVAGSTGSGKSVFLNVILSGLIYRYSPEEVKLILIDLKQVELAPYAGLPHMLLKEPVCSIPEIVNVLKWLREEVVSRFGLFKTLRIRNINEYNKLESVNKLPRIVLVIDEASELMSDPYARNTVEATLNSLARIARAAGVHMIFATQNPVKSVITSEIQNNLATKFAFAVNDFAHSLVILKQKGAECLLGRGDMYIKKTQDPVRAQCAYVSTAEIDSVVEYVKEHNECTFDDEEIQRILNGSALLQSDDKPKKEKDEPDLKWMVLKVIVDTNSVSVSYLQRKLKKGYNSVVTILEQLAAEGYISDIAQGNKEQRKILISKEDFYAEWETRFGKYDPDTDGE